MLDRRRLARRLLAWRLFAFLLLLLVALALVLPRLGTGGRYVARISVAGLIGDEDALADRVRDLASDLRVAALIVAIDSPGGAVAGGEALHDAIAAFAARKPTVAVMGGMATSAGYMIAVPTARIFAREGTLTGSIGVILEAPEAGGLLAKLGVEVQTLVSGPLKNQPSLTAPLTPAGQVYLQGVVDDLYGQFVAMVAAGRHMDPARVRALGDGRAYTGRQALTLGLVDAIGGEHAAREWLASARGVPLALPVRTLSTRRRGLLPRLLGWSPITLETLFGQGVTIDGAVSLWQP